MCEYMRSNEDFHDSRNGNRTKNGVLFETCCYDQIVLEDSAAA